MIYILPCVYSSMKKTGFLLLIFALVYYSGSTNSWVDTARIAGGVLWTDMTEEEMRETIDDLHERGQSVILTWVPDPLLEDWSLSLEFLKKASAYIDKTYPDTALIIYQGPLEIVTDNVDVNKDSKVDPGKHSIYTDHPEWLQVGIDGRKAVFYGDVAFWVGESDEDVWLCPNDPEYKQVVISHFYELAQTGIDGIWVDIPKFQCDFGDWESNWACHCEDCQKKFEEDTGFTIPKKVDWQDIRWKTWILWRQQVIADYLNELNNTIKSANPDCLLIVEHWHGIDVESVREAWSPLLLREVTDCLAHEYTAASYNSTTYDYYNYLRDMASYLYYRGLDKEHPSWILAYSSDRKGQKMLAASVITAGCNFYDTDVPDMDGTVSTNQQKEIFHWIKDYSPYYYEAEPWANIGVYYSKATMDFLYHELWGEGDFYCEFMGVSMMLLAGNIPYEVIFSLDNLNQFHTVILPNAACMSDKEIETINEFVTKGGNVIATGETGAYDEWGNSRSESLLDPDIMRIPALGAEYYREVQPYNPWWIPEHRGPGEEYKTQFLSVLENLDIPSIFEVDAQDTIVLPFVMDNTLIFRILTLSEISEGEPRRQELTLTVSWSVENGRLYPFLSSPKTIENPATFNVYDHAVVTFTVTEPVTVISNFYDRPAADHIVAALKREGFLVEYGSGCRPCIEQLKMRNQVVILGGHQAFGLEWLISEILTEEEKQLLEQKGAQYIFVKSDVFLKGQTIIVVAGNEREDTYELAETRTDAVLQELVIPM